MNQLIDEFCQDALDSGIITGSQYLILDAVFGQSDISLVEFVDFLARQAVPEQGDGIRFLMNRTRAAHAPPSAGRQVVVQPPEKADTGAPDKEPAGLRGIEWFCSLAMEEGILNQDDCWGLVSHMFGIADILGFAQAVLSTGICSSLAKVQELTDRALQKCASGERPPFSELTELLASADWEVSDGVELFHRAT